MWKYVSRRVKDTLERSCQVLDVGRASFCSSSVDETLQPQQQQCQQSSGSSGAQEIQPEVDKQLLRFKKGHGCCIRRFRNRNRFSNNENAEEEKSGGPGQERQKERLNAHDGLGQSWLGALTWSSAIVCGWYTSQYICLRRKRMGWTPMDRPQDSPASCAYSNLLLTTTRSLHSNITSRIALAAPPTYPGIVSGNKSVRNDEGNYDRNISIGHLLQNISNSKDTSTSTTLRSKSERSSSLDSAVAEFSSTIGEIEFQFGIQELQSENFKSAVGHLKLATTHHHAGATFNLGLCYEKGLGVDRDMKMAMHCYSVASAQGHPKAMYNLGVFYVRGWGGLKRSRRAARECFDSAARLGQKEAQLALDLQRQKQMRRRDEDLSSFDQQLFSATALKDVAFGVRAF